MLGFEPEHALPGPRKSNISGTPLNRKTPLTSAKALSATLGPRLQSAPARSAIRSICVYCGSGKGTDPAYSDAARTLGTSLAENGIGLVYGGGGLGLMGEVARATLAAGGKVTGIIPEFLTAREHMLTEVTDLVVTADMHERKKLMFERSDAFVALPGGIGTLSLSSSSRGLNSASTGSRSSSPIFKGSGHPSSTCSSTCGMQSSFAMGSK
jgi:hypothetical protein